MKSLFFSCFILFAWFICSEAGCGIYKATDGSSYNLNPLTTAKGYQGGEAGTQYTYFWNFCQDVNVSCLFPTPAAQVLGTTCISVGYLANTIISDNPSNPKAGFQVQYTNTQDNKCQQNTVNRVTNIIVDCDQSVEASFVDITEPGGNGGCLYQIRMKSKYACPIKGGIAGEVSGLSGGSIFLIIVLIAAVLYLSIGSIVMWKVKGHSGIEVIPNIEFWKDLPGLIKDGVLLIRSKFTGYQAI